MFLPRSNPWPRRRRASVRRAPRHFGALAVLAIALLSAASLLTAQAAGPPPGVRLLDRAELVGAAGTTSVALPDHADRDPAQVPPVERRYRWNVEGPQQRMGLFVPQLIGHARLEVNGQQVSDSLSSALEPPQRGAGRIALFAISDRFWREGANTIELTVAAPQRISLSRLHFGTMAALQRSHDWRFLSVVVGPGLIAAVVGTLGIFMLVLWGSRRDSLYAYFGAGTFGWALHTAWAILPSSLLPGDHYVIWWTSLYWLFVTMLIIFCVRFTGWKWPRFEIGLWIATAATPILLYAARALGWLEPMTDLSRLGLAILSAVGLLAVLRASFRTIDVNKALVLAFALVSVGFGFHDWLESARHELDAPVYLVPYAGIVFVVFVVRMLIDRFATASNELAVLNAELEKRVATQNTELRDTMEKMRAARDAAEAADQAKTRFLAAASHDLRQPAHALALYMGALREGPLAADQADLVQRMSGSLGALESMFSSLLDVSRIDAGAARAEPRQFALEPLLRRLADEFAPQAEASGLRIAVRLPADAAFTWSDPVLAERIVRNLLANAVKYTLRGGVLLACRLRRGPPAHWRVEVWDTGIGIADSDRERVFEEFYQVDNSGRDRSHGLGLGLSIVHRLSRLLGAPLLLRSRLGHGSCFALCLPAAVAPADAAAVAAPAPAPDLPSLHGLKVGMIEDDQDVREAMRVLLTRWGCQVVEGADADELGARLDGAAPPQLLLADHRLRDGRTGPAEAQRLFDRWGLSVPMIVVTGESNVREIEAAGHACLAKPVSPALLRRWLDASWPASARGSAGSKRREGRKDTP